MKQNRPEQKNAILPAVLAVVFVQLVSLPVLAADPTSGFSLSPELPGVGPPGTEFISGNYPGAILMPINVWGGVGRPGIHHIPTHTDLLTFLSLAGGPTADAEMNHVQIKRRNGAQEQLLSVNAEDLLARPGARAPILEANDLVIIPRDKPAVSNNTLAVLSVAATVISLVLAGFAINSSLKK